MNVFCIRHPKYVVANAPDLSCKVCCRRYVDHVVDKQKALRDGKEFDTYKWLESKTSGKYKDNNSY